MTQDREKFTVSVEGAAAQDSIDSVEGAAAHKSTDSVEGAAAHKSTDSVEGAAAQESTNSVEGAAAQESTNSVINFVHASPPPPNPLLLCTPMFYQKYVATRCGL